MNRAAPDTSGTKTPAHAMAVALSPVCLSFFMSVDRPASNMSMMTPILAIWEIKSLSSTRTGRGVCARAGMVLLRMPTTAGPIRTPASISPTTSGARNLRAAIPNNLATQSMIARSLRKVRSSIFHLSGLWADNIYITRNERGLK